MFMCVRCFPATKLKYSASGQFTSVVMELICVLLLVNGNAGTLVHVPADSVMTFQTPKEILVGLFWTHRLLCAHFCNLTVSVFD